MSAESTEAIYDANADRWAREERVLLSDFTARPFVVDELGPLAGAHVLDLGCGEGYVARLVAKAGAASVFGVDVSTEMVQNARLATPIGGSCVTTFEAGDAATLTHFTRDTYERVMAVFLFNYLTRAEMTAVLRTVRARLAPGGRFVFTVPHPCFPYMRAPSPPFFFETEGATSRASTAPTRGESGAEMAPRCPCGASTRPSPTTSLRWPRRGSRRCQRSSNSR